jgi:hypothetical protein
MISSLGDSAEEFMLPISIHLNRLPDETIHA